jgi:hypothetical protein
MSFYEWGKHLDMTKRVVEILGQFALAGVALLWATPTVRAQESLQFTLDEVEAANAPAAQAAPAAPKGEPIAHALGELRWGMHREDVLALIKKRIRADYTERVKAEHDIVRQDALYAEANEVFRRVKDGFVVFNGRKTGWDASPIAEEFAHGTNESMLVVDDPNARDLYFFFNDRLWKWYRELKPAAFGGASWDNVSSVLSEQFGAAHERAEPRSENGTPYRMLSWSDDSTRVTALSRGSETCLVFEQRATLDHLAELREHAMPRSNQAHPVLDGVIMTTAEREAWRDKH